MNLKQQLGDEWYEELKDEFKKPYIGDLQKIVRTERLNYTVHPQPQDVFKAYRLTPFSEVKAVILGQDPYPHYHANGLAFSTNEDMDDIPASLKNIFKEIENDIGFQPYHDPDLTRWAEQGVMLLNRVLTVRDRSSLSHQLIGWEKLTNATLSKLYNRKDPVVFILWGRTAQLIMKHIPEHHYIIPTPHPSPLSAYRGFFNSKPFSRCNQYLTEQGKTEIDWLKSNTNTK